MSTLFFGDLQLKASRVVEFSDWDTSESPADKTGEMCKTISWVSEVIEKESPDTVVFLGDLVEEQHKISLYTIYLVKQAFDLIIDDDREYIFILGNHDIADPTGRCNNLVLIPEQDNVRVVKSDSPYLKDDILYTSCIYAGNKPDVEAFTNLVKDIDVKTMVSHMPIKGMQFTTGLEDTDGIDPSLFNCEKIITGHYHKPDFINMGGKDIHLVGAPMYHDFRDEWDSKRGICIYDDSDSYKLLENPYTKRYVKLEYPKEKTIVGKVVEKYGAENLNIKILCPEELIESIDIEYKFNKLNIVPKKDNVLASRLDDIDLTTSYSDEIELYVDKERPKRLKAKKLRELGERFISMKG